MPEIHVLDPHLADLIAAGEVVERPASVVKELMENAIDAGAEKITVEVAHGGLTFLRVTDDGGGIPAEELATAFLRHATSKLRSPRDLEAIGTLGFRGEALAAIAAVSRIQVTSRTAHSPLAATLALEGGTAGLVEETGGPLGTTVVVRDLFYNTPARLKFMKKDASEGAAVFAAVQRLALSHPEVSVTFLRDGRQDLLTPGDGTLKNTVYAVLGRELALGFVPVKAAGEGLSVTGFVSLPACCRGSRNYQHFFVNGRYVKSPTMMAALEQAYQNQKMVGKFPGAVLHLKLKPSAVDVNVHPAKTEVKFTSDREIFSAVCHAVQSALGAGGSRSRPVKSQDSVTANQIPLSQQQAQEPLLTVGAFSYRAPAFSPRSTNLLWREEKSAALPPRTLPLPGQITLPGPPQAPPRPKGEKTPPLEITAPDRQPAQGEKAPAREITAPEEPSAEVAPWRVAGEVLSTYIVVEQGDAVLLIDKHAAHERMNFDRMKAEDYDPMSQILLSPLPLRLEAQEQAALLEQLPLLEEFGFSLEDFGGCILVRRAPFDLPPEEIPAALSCLAQRLLLTGFADPSAARDDLLHTMACKASIKGGWKTSPQELERVAQAVMSGQVKYCPHGRPVAIEMTRYQLERRFGRA